MVKSLIEEIGLNERQAGYLANDNPGQNLSEHLISVFAISMALGRQYRLEDPDLLALALGAVCHDVGKCSDRLQTFFKSGGDSGQKKDLYPVNEARHHESSWFCFKLMARQNLNISNFVERCAEFLIFYHHPKTFYQDGLSHKTLEVYSETSEHILARMHCADQTVDVMEHYLPFACTMTDYVLTRFFDSGLKNPCGFSRDELDFNVNVPSFYYDSATLGIQNSMDKSSRMHLMRSLMVRADRLVSSVSKEQLTELSGRTVSLRTLEQLQDLGEEYMRQWSPQEDWKPVFDFTKVSENLIERSVGTRHESVSRLQQSVAIQAGSATTSVVHAGAGFGKTILGLLYAAKIQEDHPGQIIWVVPRNSIAESLGREIPGELEFLLGKNHGVSVEVFLTGDRVRSLGVNCEHKEIFSSDIVITNIDNTLSPIMKHKIADRISLQYNAILILDEFHEMVSESPMFFYLMQFIYARHNTVRSPTMLMSASPLPIHQFIEEKERVLWIDQIPHWNDTRVNFMFERSPDFESKQGFLVTNSVNEAFSDHMRNKTDILAHGRYIPSHKSELVDLIIDKFGKKAHQEGRFKKTESISSALFIQAAFNISHCSGRESLLSPVKTVQVFGRINRFNEAENPVFVSQYAKGNRAEEAVMDIQFSRSLSDKWAQFLEEKSTHQSLVNAEDLKSWFCEFLIVNEEGVSTWLEKFLTASLSQGSKLPPISREKPGSSDRVYSSKGNMRDAGGSWFGTAYIFCRKSRTELLGKPQGVLLEGDLLSVSQRDLENIVSERVSIGVKDNELISIHERLNKVYDLKYPVKNHGRMKQNYFNSKFWLKVARVQSSPLLILSQQKVYVGGQFSDELKPLGLIDSKVLSEHGIDIPRGKR